MTFMDACGICKCGWPSNVFAAASCERAAMQSISMSKRPVQEGTHTKIRAGGGDERDDGSNDLDSKFEPRSQKNGSVLGKAGSGADACA